MMDLPETEFERLVAEGYELLPQWVRDKISDVALLVEDEPSRARATGTRSTLVLAFISREVQGYSLYSQTIKKKTAYQKVGCFSGPLTTTCQFFTPLISHHFLL